MNEYYSQQQWAVTVAVNGSSDQTSTISKKVAEEFPGKVQVIDLDEKGLGAAVREAWRDSTSDILAYVDADLPFRLTNLKQVLDAFDLGADVVVGSRHIKGGIYATSALRRFLSRMYLLWTNLLFNCRVTDNCGLKAVRRSSFRKLLPWITDNEWFFGTQLLVRSRALRLKLVEIPVQCKADNSRPSSVRLFSTILAYLRLTLTLRIKLWAGT
jgi:glycosyltransferase involved in cell wall biosynthesis